MKNEELTPTIPAVQCDTKREMFETLKFKSTDVSIDCLKES